MMKSKFLICLLTLAMVVGVGGVGGYASTDKHKCVKIEKCDFSVDMVYTAVENQMDNVFVLDGTSIEHYHVSVASVNRTVVFEKATFNKSHRYRWRCSNCFGSRSTSKPKATKHLKSFGVIPISYLYRFRCKSELLLSQPLNLS